MRDRSWASRAAALPALLLAIDLAGRERNRVVSRNREGGVAFGVTGNMGLGSLRIGYGTQRSPAGTPGTPTVLSVRNPFATSGTALAVRQCQMHWRQSW